MTGKFRLVLKASVIATLGCSGGMAFAQASSTTTPQVSNPGLADQPSSNPGQYAGLITMRSLDTANIVGGAVSGATSGVAGGVRLGVQVIAAIRKLDHIAATPIEIARADHAVGPCNVDAGGPPDRAGAAHW